MASPFPVNAILTFQVPTGESSIDDLGNPVIVTESLVVHAFMKESRRSSRQATETDRASEAALLSLEGRCLEPAELPPTLLVGAKAKAVIGGVEGDFYLEPVLQSAFTTVTDALGAKIRGSFETRVVYGGRG